MRKDSAIAVLFHVSPAENAASIATNGIRCDSEGYIYLSTSEVILNAIARDQLMISRYCVFLVSASGIGAKLESDDVTEFTAAFHRRIKQPLIDRKHVSLLRTVDTTDHPDAWDYHRHAIMDGYDKNEVDAYYSAVRDALAGKCSPAEFQQTMKAFAAKGNAFRESRP